MMNLIYATGLVLTLALVVILWLYLREAKRSALRISKLTSGYKTELGDLNFELNRQTLIIDDYKERLQFNDTSGGSKISTYVDVPNQELVQNMLTDTQQLQKEKELFKQKNQKLWEQSMAVYKEKERIDSIRKYVESRHTNLTHSINYALRIQEALLPSQELLKKNLPNHFILFRPRDIVSGDFYWTKQMGDKTIIVAADCTGHGVPGAFMSLLGISFLNEIVSKSAEFSAAELLEEMRDKVKSAFQQDNGDITIQDGMDMAVCILDHNNLELEFSGANNGLYIAKQDKTLIEIKATRSPVSKYHKEKAFENHSIQLQKNDSLFMYSDGYFDQFGGGDKQKITRKRFNTLLTESMENELSMTEIKKKLENFLDKWQGDEIQIDDILVFGVRI